MKVAVQRPFVFVNMAITADGKIATANRAVSSFGSAADREHLFELRATADAVIAGARTIDSSAVLLDPGDARFRRRRRRRGLAEYNLRIIVSRNASVNPKAEIFRHGFSPIIILTTAQAPISRVQQLRNLGAIVQVVGQREIDFASALRWLRSRWTVKRLLCEGGGELNDALFRAALVDELHLTVCPFVFGGRNAPTIADGLGFPRLAQAARFELSRLRKIGPELFAVFRASPQADAASASRARSHSRSERRFR